MSQDQAVPPEEELTVIEGETENAVADEGARLTEELKEMSEKYLRLYAEFDNYKKRVNKDKEELLKYGQESLLYELLTVIDNLELALKHASDEVSTGLIQGVEITYKELMKTLEKFGLTAVEAEGENFDPSVHHAMSQVVRDDVEENIVVEEYRKGYKLKDKVLRPSLVSVSKKPPEDNRETEAMKINNITEEES
ncbi:MAG: nucleotide exchange factor GrpE [Thermodesulfovibrionales bacterium]|jgi:molecular chaperone GrpE